MKRFGRVNGISRVAFPSLLRSVAFLLVSLSLLGVVPIPGSDPLLDPRAAFAAVAREKRTFTEVTVATERGASTTSALPAGGLIFYQTQELVSAINPDTHQPTTVTVTKLKFAVDPERMTSIVVGGIARAIAPGETFILDQSVPFDWFPNFTGIFNTLSLGAHDLGGGLTRVVFPYSVFEGGCAGEGFGTCTMPPGARFLNDDSDPFDEVVHFAEVIINTATKTIESMRSRVNTRISGIVPPGASNGKLIAFIHQETEQDMRCTGGGRTLSCLGLPVNSNTNTVQLGVDRNGDGIISSVLTLYDVDSAQVKYTKLKGAPAGFLLGPGGISLGAIATVDVEEFQLSMVGDLLVFKSKDQPPIPPLTTCTAAACFSSPGRAGVDYNGDGDFLDTVIRYISASGLFANPALAPTLGPTASNRNQSTPQLTQPGDLLGSDGRYIYYYLSEAESPAPPSTTFPPTCTDLNRDCDNSDFVLHVFDTQATPPTDPVTNAMAALHVLGGGVTQAGGGIVSFGTDERSEGTGGFGGFGTDFNADGDFEDTQLRFLDANTQTLVTTNVTLIDNTSAFQAVRLGTLPGTDGSIIAYTAALLNGGFLGSDTPIDIRFIRLPGQVQGGGPSADTTPPTTTATASPGANPSGWNNTNVTVTLTATDDAGGSGVKEIHFSLAGAQAEIGIVSGGATSVTVSAEGTTTLTYFAKDNAGNQEAAKTLTVKIDKTPPTLTFGAVSPTPNAAGWNNTDPVTISFTATDTLSGVATTSATSPLAFTGETAGATQTVTVTDVAGNTATVTSPAVKIDKAPPTVTFGTATPTPNAAGWNDTNVSVPFTISDNLSGVATTSPATSPLLLTMEGAAVTGAVTVTDRAGNSTTITSPPFKIDKTPPSLTFGIPTPAPNAAGWNNTNVSIPFTASDSLSGVATTIPSASSLVLAAEGAAVTGTVTVTDAAGDTATFTSPAVKIDRTPPTITIASPASDGTYVLNAAAAASYTCTDIGPSGIATCSGPVASGVNFSTNPIGANSFTVNASDVAGNPASATNAYKVVYNFSGFLPPLSAGTSARNVKLGSSVPIKWQLADANGAFIGTAVGATTLMVDSVSCSGVPDLTPPFDSASSGSTVLRYDTTSNQYVFNWQTNGLAAGCYKILMNPGDGVTRTTMVQLTP